MIKLGRTLFYTETGTEGGYWAFQDEAHIKPNTTRFSCTKCNMYWDKVRSVDEPVFDGNYCRPGEHDFQLFSKEDWSYDGLHVLKDRDILNILDDEEHLLWSGTIKLKYFDAFTEDIDGWWIHSEQEGIDRVKWAKMFMKEHKAILYVPEPKDTKTI